jgi:hypothetical protein
MFLHGIQRGIKLGQSSIKSSFKCYPTSIHFPFEIVKHTILKFYSGAFYMFPESEDIALDYDSI